MTFITVISKPGPVKFLVFYVLQRRKGNSSLAKQGRSEPDSLIYSSFLFSGVFATFIQKWLISFLLPDIVSANVVPHR